MNESLDRFKEKMSNILKNVLDDNNIMKQELFILRQNSRTGGSNSNQETQPASDAGPTPSSSPAPSSRAKAPAPPSRTKAPEPRNNALPPKRKQSESKVLLIGDSISGNIDLDVIEDAVKGKVRACKAYAAAFDNVGNNLKEAARYSKKNFKDVVPAEVMKEPIEYLLLQAGSVDITNLKTKDNSIEKSENLKEEVRLAAKNLFSSAEAALEAQPSIKKVVIMTLTPRYDLPAVDPRSLKPAMAQMYNNTLGELWLDSSLKDRIVIGIHRLECAGGIREARFRDLRNRRYDGIHMYGPSGKKAYTISVLDILSTADITDSTTGHTGQDFYSRRVQFQYQKQKHNRSSHRVNTKRTNLHSDNDRDVRQQKYKRVQNRYTVPTSNMFEHLNC